MSGELRTTALHSWHSTHGGRMVEFGGWSMPVQYSSIVEEHNACRQQAALFDVSHMGRLWFSGPQATSFLDHLLTRKISDMPRGRVRYSLVCNAAGGILDDVLLYNLSTASTSNYLLVVNASNREKIIQWITPQLTPEVTLLDQTLETSMIAVQGPQAIDLAEQFCAASPAKLGYYHAAENRVLERQAIVSRTGYTGEDGVEIILPNAAAEQLWTALLTAGAQAAGLGARDTLRLEAAMPLYGHELSETISPLQAGLVFAVNFQQREFIGKQALLQQKQAGQNQQRVGLRMLGRRVPREHYAVYTGEEKMGEVTSGTFSPTLNQPIAMAYVATPFATSGTPVTVDIRGSREAAEVCSLPFYHRK